MKTNHQIAALKAGEDSTQIASLRSATAFSASDVKVDAAEGTIFNASVMTIGAAKGYGISCDQTTLQQLRDGINVNANGVPVRFRHPLIKDDGRIEESLGTEVGYLRNARIVGDSVRGDVHLAAYAEILPQLGNVKAYLLKKAETDPTGIGLSAMFSFEREEVLDAHGNVIDLVFRVGGVAGVDFVSNPAANPNGLLSAGPLQTEPTKVAAPVVTQAIVSNTKTSSQVASLSKGVSSMNPKLKQYLIANHGVAADATDEVAQAAYAALSADDKVKADTATLSAKTVEPTVQLAVKHTDVGDEVNAMAARRVAQLRQLGTTLGVDDAVVALAIADGATVPDAQTRYLKHLQEKCKPISGLNVSVGGDKKIAALAQAFPDAICKRAGLAKFYAIDGAGRILRDSEGAPKEAPAHELADKFIGLSALDMYRHWLIAHGADREEVAMLSRTSLADLMGPRALRRRFPQVAQLAQSTGDFANVVLDAQNKSMRMGYVEAQRTWTLWAKRGTAPDFKNINRIQTSEIPTLTSRTEGQPISYTTLSDSKETYALAEYANGIILTRRVMINDDLNALTDVPRKQGQAAARLEDDVAYAIITANANLADGGALFNATAYTVAGTGHQNRQSTTAGVGAPSVAVISATEKLIMLQKGPKNAAILNLTPKFWLGPVALKTTAEQFFASRVDPSKSNETPNPYNGKIVPISNARLDANSAVIHYLLCDYRDGQIDTVEVSFLTDEPEPVLKQETDFDTDDQKFAVRHTVAAKALDFRGMARNDGA